MVTFFDVGTMIPPKGKLLLCYCPEWSDMEFELAYWNEDDGFHASNISNDSPFNELVEKFAILDVEDLET